VFQPADAAWTDYTKALDSPKKEKTFWGVAKTHLAEANYYLQGHF
jgi:hypothetical protein